MKTIFRTNPFRLLVRRHHQQAMMKTLYWSFVLGMLFGSLVAIYLEEL